MKRSPVTAKKGTIVLPTYLPAAPDRNPMFLEKRVYQGSSGRVYPLPFTDRIAEKPVERAWKAVWLENEFLRVLILPEIGGRIHAILDKSSGYDLVYNQPVIKPALVGLAGPWISGGIELNWPQHHRPATFMPVDYVIEEQQDGSKIVWCSDHDPMERMKGMHGVCLHPGKAYLELKVRVYNRTPFTRTFLWWANVATQVHEAYKSFFPPDVRHVADHAKRAMSEYPLAESVYYGVNYGERGRKGVPAHEVPSAFVPGHCHTNDPTKGESKMAGGAALPAYAPNDLSFYANIPTPCSYMCMGSEQDFFGGYDYKRGAGIVHVANHHISPGKKQWTWGNHEFGYAWDRNLTERDKNGEYPPYIELMAGVYTDNQPDFSFLRPGETKDWSQYWYPIHKIGPAQHANLNAAVSLVSQRNTIFIGVSVTASFPRAEICAQFGRRTLRWVKDLEPGKPFCTECKLPKAVSSAAPLSLHVMDANGQEIITWSSFQTEKAKVAPTAATEPPAPKDVASADELYLIGVHLEQYRHASRCPTLYWREALRRDPGDSRCNNGVGLWHLRRGEFGEAEVHFRAAIKRQTSRNPNPADGEVFYNLGLCLRFLGRDEDAYAAFYKSTWNQAWQAAGYHAIAELDCKLQNWSEALAHLDQSLCYNCENTRARDLKALVLARLGKSNVAKTLLKETIKLDPLDWWARSLPGNSLECDNQTLLDLVHDHARAGLYVEASELVLERLSLLRTTNSRKKAGVKALADQNLGSAPLLHYTLAWVQALLGNAKQARAEFQRAAKILPDYCFPARLEEIAVFESAIKSNPRDARARYYLGNLLYDRKRHEEAIFLWEQSAQLEPSFSVVWRNLGIGYFNVLRDSDKSRAAYEKAWKAESSSARLLYERDQLWKRLREDPDLRLKELESHLDLVRQRDDLSVEICALYNQTGQHEKALSVLEGRRFQPWEGGEGQALGEYVRTRLALGRTALTRDNAAEAAKQFEAALHVPDNLAEAKHQLANQSNIYCWLGAACRANGDNSQARKYWKLAADFKGDFQGMKVRPFSEMTYYSALAARDLGNKRKSRTLLTRLLSYARDLYRQPATIDYFATSLPTMLLFDDDLQARQRTNALFLQAQAHLGLGRKARALSLLKSVLQRDPNHSLAGDLLRDNTTKRP